LQLNGFWPARADLLTETVRQPDDCVHQFYAQIDKKAAIIDERFNLGGALPEAIVDALGRSTLSLAATRDEAVEAGPSGIYGPKALLINAYAGPGGDALALYFREMRLGPLIGKRTWGGLAGASFEHPALMDGGVAEVPTTLLWGPGQNGEVENRGVAPDIEVDLDPEQVRKGHQPQLEAAIRSVMAALPR
jgi:tricorn protease